MDSKRHLPALVASVIISLLACALCGVSRADTTTGLPVAAIWTPPSRPASAFFPVPPDMISPAAPSQTLPIPALVAPGTPVRPAAIAGSPPPSPGEACRVAILRAAARYGIPADLMLAISLVESGRTDPSTGVRTPWPWTANVEGQDYRFETSEQAAAWLRQQQSHNILSIDTGCMQVNLKHHPDAFATAEEAFDPAHNADYAARFLRSLYDGPADRLWMRAAGFYHSQTPERAEWYQGLVEAAMKGPLPAQSLSTGMFGAVGGGGQSLSNHSERARILPAVGRPVGRSLEGYRGAPILAANRGPHLSIMATLRR